MPVRERILAIGITGAGKSYQWLKLAEALLPTGAKFRCIDTDAAIDFMLETQFPHLRPENGGNVYVYPVFNWPDYRNTLEEVIMKEPIEDKDWLIVDMADTPWESTQRYFTSEIFEKSMGDYFLQVRKELQASKKKTSSVAREAFDGWMDWSVVNKLYFDWINPIIYQMKCHVYGATKVQKLGKEDDPDIKELFGEYGIRPTGQKALGHQFHSILLLIPGKERWFITTIKDRGGRTYFKRTPFVSLYMQYLVAKAHWPMVEKGA